MEANEILNNEELIDVTDEVIKTPPVESNSVVGKLVVGIGVLGVAGVAVLLYKKHKNKTNDNDDCDNKRRFTLLKSKDENDEDELEELDPDEYEEEKVPITRSLLFYFYERMLLCTNMYTTDPLKSSID